MVGKISCESKVSAGTVVREYKVGAENECKKAFSFLRIYLALTALKKRCLIIHRLVYHQTKHAGIPNSH